MAKRNRGLQEPTKLKTPDADTGLFQVIIETPTQHCVPVSSHEERTQPVGADCD